MHLLKTKAFNNSTNQKTDKIANSDLSRFLTNLKKTFSIIYQFNKLGKRILFVGTPKELNLKINKQTLHTSVSRRSNLHGVVSGRANYNLKDVKKRHKHNLSPEELFPKLKKKPDLVVLVAHSKQKILIQECLVAKVPLISFHFGRVDSLLKHEYTVITANEKKIFEINTNLLALGLGFLFHKS